jgi:endo-1,3(4)-beta-glucanase
VDEESVPLHGPTKIHKKRSIRFCLIAAGLIAVALVAGIMRVSRRGSQSACADFPLGGSSSLSLSPVAALDMLYIDRQFDASPSKIWGNISAPLPTNSWYLNLVSHRAAHQPDDSTRVYTVPYIIDTAAANEMAGIRVHWPVVSANTNNVQMVDDFKNGITLGTSDRDVGTGYKVDDKEDLSHLGVSLKWGIEKKSIKTHIVRGMPFATVQYFGGALPSIYSYNGPASAVKVDGSELECGVMKGKAGPTMEVQKEIRLHFINSDFTWIVLFSSPVKVSCAVSEGDEKTREFKLDVVSYKEPEEGHPLVARLALLNQCTTGMSDIKDHCLENAQWTDQKKYEQLLIESADVYPSSPQLDFTYPESTGKEAQMTIDWGARSTTGSGHDKLLMFALPHHQESLKNSSAANITDQCMNTFHGSTCLVSGSIWSMTEDMGDPMSFTAPRPPEPDSITALADALSDDIHYELSDNMLRGAADTYFSGKILARLGRVIVIASEMNKLASGDIEDGMYTDVDDDSLSLSMEAAAAADLPSDDDIADAVEQLKRGVEIWINGKAEAPYIYDRNWGGIVNCGCTYHGEGDKGICNNTFPECPALVDVNEDFGNGYYNDHHFHYGYHLYAAAVVSKFDPEWAKEYFDRVLLYVRDFANPTEDKFFIQFRQKDWWLGSSWASGIISAENSPHGRNQESSSESIAAYEAVALYGAVMVDVFSDSGSNEQLETAKIIRNAGQLLTATELRAANNYWHVWSSKTHANTYPAAYKQPVVGMLYETMASFQTWFSPLPVVSYGIQLLPFTPVAEKRDDPEWASTLYPLYEESCQQAGDFCIDNGWSVIQAGLCATAGDRKEALEQALAVPTKVFASEGGVGNSLSNTIWYIGTRKQVSR